jgi:hypothetical protein
MATVKICTARGFCMKCTNTTLAGVIKTIKETESSFFCCGTKCIRVTDISTIEEVKREGSPPDDEEDNEDAGPLIEDEGDTRA